MQDRSPAAFRCTRPLCNHPTMKIWTQSACCRLLALKSRACHGEHAGAKATVSGQRRLGLSSSHSEVPQLRDRVGGMAGLSHPPEIWLPRPPRVAAALRSLVLHRREPGPLSRVSLCLGDELEAERADLPHGNGCCAFLAPVDEQTLPAPHGRPGVTVSYSSPVSWLPFAFATCPVHTCFFVVFL